jgi:signal transduction histidine kinase
MRGLGLMGMRERAALFGARCEIVSQPGKGTRMRVLVPLLGNEVLEEDSPAPVGANGLRCWYRRWQKR